MKRFRFAAYDEADKRPLYQRPSACAYAGLVTALNKSDEKPARAATKTGWLQLHRIATALDAAGVDRERPARGACGFCASRLVEASMTERILNPDGATFDLEDADAEKLRTLLEKHLEVAAAAEVRTVVTIFDWWETNVTPVEVVVPAAAS